MWQDFRFAARMLRKAPGFSAVAVATLALGIGANTAVFSLVDTAILRPLAYRDAGRLFAIHEVVPKFAYIAPLVPVNALHFDEWRKHAHSFEDMALIAGDVANLTGTGGEPQQVHRARVSPSLFRLLGVEAQIGRTLRDDEDAEGKDDVVAISHEFWQARLGSDPGIVGRTLKMNDRTYRVVGVLPASFHFPKLSQLYAMTIAQERPDIWKPFALRDSEKDDMGDFNFVCIAKARPGVSAAQAEAELNGIQAGIAARLPEKIELRARVVPLQDQVTGRTRGGLELMLAAVGAVLLIACVNIANLLLARATGRRRELAVRAALGAGTGRLVRQMLAESLLLAAAGGALGMALAYGGIHAILAYAPVDLPRMDEVAPDLRLLAFNLAISLGAGLIFGLLPAWRYSKADPQEALQSGSRGSTGSRASGRVRQALVAAEVALSAVCLVAGGLLLHSFVNLMSVDKGFDTDRIVTADFTLPYSRYPAKTEEAEFERRLLEKALAIPGVTSAGVSNQLPLAGEGNNNTVAPEGSNLPPMDRPLADRREVNPDYFRTMGIRLLAGRFFEERDRHKPVAVISAMMAARLWPGENAVGKRLIAGSGSLGPIEVVGIVGDIRGASLNHAPFNTMYVPYWQDSNYRVSLAVRTALPAGTVGASIRAAVRQLDPELPPPEVRTMDERLAESVAPRRFQMTLVLLFAVAALLLASLGIYGVVAYSVGQRTGEMGIRMALGAQPGAISGMVLRQAMAPVAIGLAAGLAGGVAMQKLLGALLFGVKGPDVATMAAVPLLLAAVAAMASWAPARRATRIDPAVALRGE
jgi:putative ABC transport system permease protein